MYLLVRSGPPAFVGFADFSSLSKSSQRISGIFWLVICGGHLGVLLIRSSWISEGGLKEGSPPSLARVSAKISVTLSGEVCQVVVLSLFFVFRCFQ